MKANHTKHGQVTITDINAATVTILTATGETKNLMKGFANLTDENGNVIDLNTVVIKKESPAFVMPVYTEEEKAAMNARIEKRREEKEAFKSWKSDKSEQYMTKGIKFEY